ncbi:PsbP-related protein [Ornithinimicrobium sediminis]|uniref:PsbP-related protein n=1 Tax=Ornithinimicrobium sediminis TaxID=2904603 RepID=UPI001E528312|nr:PsbP-related protein [Ornithinimicrobium sediminis]MCE0486308.1 hypothetical protein [Ornithinimicrobium sediminis]
MSNRARAWVVPTTVALSLALLTGCSGEDDPAGSADPVTDVQETSAPDDAAVTTSPPDDAESTTEAPAPVTSADDAFSFEVPQEWSDAGDQAGADAVAAARADERTDDFFTNLVVVTEEPISDLEEAIEEAAETIAGEDGSHEMLEDIEIDGRTAYGYQLTRTVEDVDIVQVQRWVEHEDSLYILTLSAAESRLEEAQAELEEILGSWTWQ